jgi:hypothetical protein
MVAFPNGIAVSIAAVLPGLTLWQRFVFLAAPKLTYDGTIEERLSAIDRLTRFASWTSAAWLAIFGGVTTYLYIDWSDRWFFYAACGIALVPMVVLPAYLAKVRRMKAKLAAGRRSNMRLSGRAVNKRPVVLLRRAAQLWR